MIRIMAVRTPTSLVLAQTFGCHLVGLPLPVWGRNAGKLSGHFIVSLSELETSEIRGEMVMLIRQQNLAKMQKFVNIASDPPHKPLHSFPAPHENARLLGMHALLGVLSWDTSNMLLKTIKVNHNFGSSG